MPRPECVAAVFSKAGFRYLNLSKPPVDFLHRFWASYDGDRSLVGGVDFIG